MRTLQEKYNAIQEGKFSKDQFLVEARMQQPQLVTRFNGYDDAVQILKNKGMIAEGIHDRDILSRPLSNPAIEPLDRSPEELGKDADARSHNILRMTYRNQINDPNISDEELRFILGGKGVKGFGGTPNAIDNILRDRNSNQSGLNEAKLTKKSLTDYRYKPTNEMDKYPYEQILRGLRVELEVLGVHGTPTAEEYSKALAKVSKNLAKDSIFYTNQVAGVNPKVDQHDQMITATAKNTVDTFNGMKKAELKEGFKKLIRKVLSETVIDVEDYNGEDDEVYEMYGEDSVDESAMGDIYQIAQEYDRFEDFVQAVEDEFGPVEDIAELEHIFNSTRGEDDIDYGDENFSDSEIDTEYESPSDRMYNSDAWVQAQKDMMEAKKSLSELLK